jgi:predicted O-methyltransferase YrrM
MSEERWSAVDDYITDMLVGEDAALRAAVSESTRAGLPAIAVSPPQGKLLYLIARLHRARSILELGTLGGYSTIWLARALPSDGRLVTLELEPHYAQVARTNIERAGVADLVEQSVGPALDSLRALREERAGPFDMVFIDADKASTPEYFAQALELTRSGSVIIVDNVVRGGTLIDERSSDAGSAGMRRFHELLARGGPWSATTIQTVGNKGYDGFTFVLLD